MVGDAEMAAASRRNLAAREPVRFSNLRNMSRSPAHYLHGLRGRKDTASFRLGRLVDVAILGGEQPLVWEGSRRGKAWDEFEASHPGREIVTLSEQLASEPVIEALRAHEHAMYLLTSGVAKKRLYWEWLGRSCTGEPDVAGKYLVDLKTARCAEPGRFVRQGTWYAYHAQMAWYRQGMLSSGLQPPGQVYIVAVETEPPYPVTVLSLTERAIEQGERLCRLWMERLIGCEAVGHWPAYCESAVDFDVPEELDLSFGDDDEAAA